MSCPILNTFKTYALAGLVALFSGLLLGNVNSSFANPTMVGDAGDFEMWINTNETLEDDETEMFNNFLNVFIAAYVATEGNLEVVVLDHNTICISGHNGSCLSKVAPPNREVATEVESKKAPVEILTAYDQ